MKSLSSSLRSAPFMPYQKADGLIVLDYSADQRRQYDIYTLDENGTRRNYGFLMRRE